MDALTAIQIVEEPTEETTHDEIVAAWQFLHTSGIGYQLQGSYQRGMAELLARGLIS